MSYEYELTAKEDLIVTFIDTHPLFRTVSNSINYDKLLSHLNIIETRKNQHIYYENDNAVSFYIIITGKVKLYKNTQTGHQLNLMILQSGDSFGEIGIFEHQRTGGATTLQPSQLLEIKRDIFNYLLSNNVGFAKLILEKVSSWIVRANDYMYALHSKNENSKQNIYLALNDMAIRTQKKSIEFCERDSDGNIHIKSDITQKELSAIAGLSLTRFNIKLKELESKNLIKIVKSSKKVDKYIITDLKKLRGY